MRKFKTSLRERHHGRSRRRTHAAPLASILAGLYLASGPAFALDFQADFRNSTYQVVAGDTFSDLLAQHQTETLIQANTTAGLENISTSVHAGGVTSNYSMLLQTTLEVGVAGEYTFQVGTDWGRGGAAALIDNDTASIVSERVLTDDVWWAYDWSNSDVFTTVFDFEVGDSYTLAWVGFEGCCGGSTTLRFSIDGGAYLPLTSPNVEMHIVPEPSIATLVMLGLAGLALRTAGARRRIAS